MEIKRGKNTYYIGEHAESPDAEIHFVPATPALIIIDHTYVSESLRGQKVGEQLVKQVVDYAREGQIKIVPHCPFAKTQFAAYAEYRDVLAT
ncbi:GNAT family N-acetyltransferase [Planococcus shixiaomingii]|uniref:GNAT family N-acetyltransferase n=1 Tax=Planococcus shixiaomingii TaxID=3058393 RepID=UPI002629E981|nr:GNAT family N-acetyltransferase [Planococcus sp. N022]WKA54522.1 GNAT family N-acetyltransferase [Planococcus sp. N022]